MVGNEGLFLWECTGHIHFATIIDDNTGRMTIRLSCKSWREPALIDSSAYSGASDSRIHLPATFILFTARSWFQSNCVFSRRVYAEREREPTAKRTRPIILENWKFHASIKGVVGLPTNLIRHANLCRALILRDDSTLWRARDRAVL